MVKIKNHRTGYHNIITYVKLIFFFSYSLLKYIELREHEKIGSNVIIMVI